MSLTPEQIAEVALGLPLKERVELAKKIVLSLELATENGSDTQWEDLGEEAKAEIKAAIAKGLAQLDRGEFVDWNPDRIRAKGQELLGNQQLKEP
jgi:hypothetical protein